MDKFGWENYKKRIFAQADVAAGLSLPEQTQLARVTAENRGNWTIGTVSGELLGVILRNFTRSNLLPKVGDWVVYKSLPDKERVLIEKVLPRFSQLSRKDPKPGEAVEEQVLAVNVDKVFLVQGLDNNFNLNRLERYLVAVQQAGAEPAIVLNKTDAAQGLDDLKQEAGERLPGIKIFFVSAKTGAGMKELKDSLGLGETVVFLGSSGVGKSTLINWLLSSLVQETKEVRGKDSKGRHTTTRREMFILPGGGIVIDTPGMRELQLWAGKEAVTETFEDIRKLIRNCRFADCTHGDKAKGCAVRQALENGELAEERYNSFIKLLKETEFQDNKENPVYQKGKKEFWKKINKQQNKIYKSEV